MALTVRDALGIGALRQCRLVAGSGGIDREVLYVDSMEVPDIFPWLKKSELLITTGYSIKNDPGSLVRLVRELDRAGAAGLAIKTRYIGDISPDMIDVANELNLPLIEIDQDIPFIDIITPLMKSLVNHQNEQLEFSQQINERLIQVGLNAEGMDSIVETMSEILERPVAVCDEDFSLLSTSSGSESWATHAISSLSHVVDRESLNDRVDVLHPAGTEDPLLLQQVHLRQSVVGYLLAPLLPEQPQEMLLVALSHGANSVGFEFAKIESREKDARVADNNFFIDLLTNSVRHEDVAASRASALDWPTAPFSMATVDVVDFESVIRGMREEEIPRLKDEIAAFIRRSLEASECHGAVVSTSDCFTLVLPRTTDIDATTALMGALVVALRAEFGLVVTVGMAGPCPDYSRFADFYRETRHAVTIARCHGAPVVHIDNARLERALLIGIGEGYLTEFADALLSPIVESDRSSGSEFMRTLSAFTANLGAKNKTASDLYLHRNTLTSRLNRIEQLLGLDLSDPETIVELKLALQIKALQTVT